jgi:hypothetical protein
MRLEIAAVAVIMVLAVAVLVVCPFVSFISLLTHMLIQWSFLTQRNLFWAKSG